MKLLITTFAITIFNLGLFAQKLDTLYYDKEWDECSKELAFYYAFNKYDENYSGVRECYYLTGQKHSTKQMRNGSKHGPADWWYKNGQKWCEGNYEKGKEHGKFIYWYPNGVKKEEGTYNEGDRVEGWKNFGKDGVRYFYVDELDETPLFKKAKNWEESIEQYFKYVEENIQFPKEAKMNSIEGTVDISFSIDKKGRVINVEVSEGINHYLDAAAVKIIEKMPKWSPPIKDGKAVRIVLTAPVEFKLQ